MPRKQIWSGAVLAAVAASSLTGCSLKASDGTPQSFGKLSALSAADAIQAATRAVAAHPSAKVHTVLTARTASETSDVVATFDEHPTLQGTLVMGSGDSGAQAAPAIPIRYTDDVMYMQMGDVSQLAAQMNGKAWLKMDLQAMAKDPNTAAYGTDVLENTSPSKGLTVLAAAKDLHEVGEEQHNGVQTVHYAGSVTGADATDPNLAGTNGLTQDDADVVSEALAQGAVTKLGYDVWLGAGAQPVAMTFTEVTPAGSLSGEIDYSAWGTAVAVTPIPDSQSADFVAMVKQAEAAQSGSQDSGSGTPSSPASTPSTPATPSTSATPSTPSTPGTPSTPATPSAPGTPATPAPTTPSVPATPSAPTPTGPASTTGSSSSASTSAPSSTSTASSSAS